MKTIHGMMNGLDFTPKLFFLLAGISLAPALSVLYYQDELRYVVYFLIPAGITAAAGLLLHRTKQMGRTGSTPTRQHDVVVVVAIWLYAFLIGALPFWLSGQLTWLPALFESVSGWTATGFTTIDVSKTPHIFLLYRSWMQFCGGLGFVLLILLFAGGRNAMKLFSAEGHPDKLEPSLINTARLTMKIYLSGTGMGALLYRMFGMSWFDALNHAMSAMATGGFSTKLDSIGYYHSVPIEVVTMVLMLIGGTNFAILALLFKRRRKEFAKVGEIRFAAVLIGIATVGLTLVSVYSVYAHLTEAVRAALFHSISAITSTGFLLDDTVVWPSSMRMLLILLMLIGGGGGSTAGGMKYSRVYLLWNSFWWRLEQKFMPERSVRQISVYRAEGKTPVSQTELAETHHFAVMYLTTFLLGSFLLTLGGASLEQAVFDFASALGTIGLSTGLTTADTSHYILMVQLVGMILARLEIYIVIIFLLAGIKQTHHYHRVWNKRRAEKRNRGRGQESFLEYFRKWKNGS